MLSRLNASARLGPRERYNSITHAAKDIAQVASRTSHLTMKVLGIFTCLHGGEITEESGARDRDHVAAPEFQLALLLQ